MGNTQQDDVHWEYATMTRYVLEGTWSGYHSGQRRVAHREVVTRPKYYEHLNTIVYTDGTCLSISMRPCKPREKVTPLLGYSSLIRDAAALGKSYVTVDELVKKRKA